MKVVCVSGAPGLGKSRLVREFQRSIDMEGRGIQLLTSRCSKEESVHSLRTAESLLRYRFGLPVGTPEEECRKTLHEVLKGIVDGSRLAEAVQLVSFLLGLPLPDVTVPGTHIGVDSLNARALNTLFNLLRFDVSQRPLVLILEDYDWATEQDKETLSGLLHSLKNTATMIVLVARIPVAQHEIGSDLTQIKLKPLAEVPMTKVVKHLLRQIKKLPQALLERTVDRAKGNPGLLEDMVRLMLQRGLIVDRGDSWELKIESLDRTRFPSSIRSVARERVAGLKDEERELLELGSVFGPVFWVGGLLSMSCGGYKIEGHCQALWSDESLVEKINAQLLSLESQDLIAYRAESGLPEQTAYGFANPIEQQKLYSKIPTERRQYLHRMAAQWLHRIAPSESFQIQEIVAWHYESGGENSNAADAYYRAGQLAGSGYQNHRACDLYRRAIDLLDESHSEILCAIYCDLADTHSILGEHDEAQAACEALLFHSAVISQSHWAGRAFLRIGRMASGQGRYDSASDSLDLAHRLFDRSGDLDGVSDCLEEVGKIHWYRGANASYRDALGCFMKSLSLRRKTENSSNIALSLSNIGNIHLARGHVNEAQESFHEALLIRRANANRLGLAHTLVGMGAVHYECGRFDDAEKVWSEGLILAGEVGDRELSAIMQNNLGELCLFQEKHEEAETLLGRAFDTAVDLGDRRTQADCLRNKARLASCRGLWERSLMLSRESVKMAESTGGKQILGSCLRTRGEILASMVKSGTDVVPEEQGDLEKEASAAFQRAIRYFEEMGDMMDLSRTLEAYGNFLEQRGVGNKARKLLSRAHKLRSAFSQQA